MTLSSNLTLYKMTLSKIAFEMYKIDQKNAI